MSSFGQVTLREVWEMLERCAPGYTKKPTNHYYCIRYNGLTYPTLPLGSHGSGDHRTIQLGHVKKMARKLGVLECATAVLDLD